MAQVIYGDDSIFAAATYGRPPPVVYDYLQQEAQRTSGLLSQAGQWVRERAQHFAQHVFNDQAFRIAHAAIRQIQSLWGQDVIQPLNELWQLQNAPNTMVRWLMANPTVRTLYQQERCAAYGERYVDAQPGAIGWDHLDYRLLNNGIVVETEDGWEATNMYVDSDEYEAAQLTFQHQRQILAAWSLQDCAVEEGRDPTSVFDIDLPK